MREGNIFCPQGCVPRSCPSSCPGGALSPGQGGTSSLLGGVISSPGQVEGTPVQVQGWGWGIWNPGLGWLKVTQTRKGSTPPWTWPGQNRGYPPRQDQDRTLCGIPHSTRTPWIHSIWCNNLWILIKLLKIFQPPRNIFNWYWSLMNL